MFKKLIRWLPMGNQRPGLKERLCAMNPVPNTKLLLGITFKCDEPADDGMGYQNAAVVASAHTTAEFRLELPVGPPVLH